MDKLSSEKQRWGKECVDKFLSSSPERRSQFKTLSDIPVERVYTPVELDGFDYLNNLGFPGEYPYTRGVYPTMYRGKFWTMRMTAGFGTAKESNQRYKYLLEHGETGIAVANGTPTLMGLDSDDPRAHGEVGRTGVAIDSVQDMEELFADIPIDKISVALINVNVPYCIFAMYLAMAEKRGINTKKLVGSMSNDPIRNCICMSGIVFPLKPSVAFAVDSVKYCIENVPKWNPITVAGYHIREWGIKATQELAFTLADGICYLEESMKLGFGVDQVAPLLAFYFNAYTDIFEEAAKFRAARRIWARLMKEKYGAKNPASMRLRFHTQTSGQALTSREPENNIVRVALQALAAILGGTQSLHTNCWDECYAIPSEESVKIALRTQQVIAEESGVANTVDPLGGSYYIESLTNRIEQEVMDYLNKIESLGGVLNAVENQFFQREILKTSYEKRKEIETGEKVIVGVNKYVTEEEKAERQFFELDERVEKEQIAKLKALKRTRDNTEVVRKLNDLKVAVQQNKHFMPYLIEAAKAYATIGEMVNTMKEVVGEYQSDKII